MNYTIYDLAVVEWISFNNTELFLLNVSVTPVFQTFFVFSSYASQTGLIPLSQVNGLQSCSLPFPFICQALRRRLSTCWVAAEGDMMHSWISLHLGKPIVQIRIIARTFFTRLFDVRVSMSVMFHQLWHAWQTCVLQIVLCTLSVSIATTICSAICNQQLPEHFVND